MTFDEIKAAIYRRCRYPSSPTPDIQTRIADLINDTHEDVLVTAGLQRLRDNVFPFLVPANIARTGIPPAVARIIAITDRTHNYKLRQVPLHELRITDPAQSSLGSYPTRYAVIGDQAVYKQPTQGTGLWVSSSAAGDTTQKAYVETINTSGVSGFAEPYDVSANGTILTGTARVQVGADVNHLLVTKFYLDMPCSGYALLHDAASSGNELARIPIGTTYSRYSAIEWWPIPTSDTTLYADVTRTIFPMIKGTDEPLIPEEFHAILTEGSLYREWTILGDSRAAIAKVNYDEGVRELKTWVMGNGDRIASFRPTAPRFNRLGSQYPAEGWPY